MGQAEEAAHCRAGGESDNFLKFEPPYYADPLESHLNLVGIFACSSFPREVQHLFGLLNRNEQTLFIFSVFLPTESSALITDEWGSAIFQASLRPTVH